MTTFFDPIPLILTQPEKPAAPAPAPTGADAPTSSKDKGGPAPAKDAATTGQPAGNGTTAPRPQPSFFDQSFLFILMGGLLLMIIFSMRTQRKEKKKREELMSSLKKGDRIQTIGGMLATVVEVKPDRVVLKADENNNTKLTFVRSAIQAVINDSGDKPEPEVKKE